MFDGLFIASIIGTCVQAFKEAREPVVPVENWSNKKLYNQDVMNSVPIEQRMKNLENGKYKQVEEYAEPHRDKNGKIVIENCLLYNNDLDKYGAVQAMKWAEQGKYNLTPEELDKERKRIEAKYNRMYGL